MSRRLNPLPQLVADRLARIQENVDRMIWARREPLLRRRQPRDGRAARRRPSPILPLHPRNGGRALRGAARRLVAPVVPRGVFPRPGKASAAGASCAGSARGRRPRSSTACPGRASIPATRPARCPTRRPSSTWTPPLGKPVSGLPSRRRRSARTGYASTSPSCASATPPPGT